MSARSMKTRRPTSPTRSSGTSAALDEDAGLAEIKQGPGGVRPDETQATRYQDHCTVPFCGAEPLLARGEVSVGVTAHRHHVAVAASRPGPPGRILLIPLRVCGAGSDASELLCVAQALRVVIGTRGYPRDALQLAPERVVRQVNPGYIEV